ncbi:MAG: tetratricopeptide repeat protein [Minwuia sp.]|uniref:tetratricopeptide repeat protein n=1 Tax=Minwuia sp. TaxID=2493630 RepID=UPI003A8481E7
MLAASAAQAVDLPPSYQDVCRAENHPDWAYGKDGTPVQYQPLFGCDGRFGPRRDIDEQFVEKLQATGLEGPALSWELVRHGWDWMRRQSLSHALNRFNLAFEADPANGDVYHGIAVIMNETAQSGRVVDYWFRQAVEKERGQAGRFADYGRFLTMQERDEDALAMLEKSIELEPFNAWTMVNLATVYFRQGDMQRGCAMVERIGTASPPPGYPEERFRAIVDHWLTRGKTEGCGS